ncbi:phage-like element PBSX protein XkdQ, partial [Paenibacillus sp. A3]
LKLGKLDDTKHAIPGLSENNTKLLDIIYKALDKTLIATKKIYVLFDDFGELTLRDAETMALDFSLGDTSLVYDYKQKRSLDNASNKIKIVRDNKESGKRELYIVQDSRTIAKWGLLQHYQTVDEKVSVEKVKEMLDNLIQLKNREQRSFSIDALGDIRVRAGCYVSINMEELGLNQRFLVNECTHKFDGGVDHTMSLELIDIRIGER